MAVKSVLHLGDPRLYLPSNVVADPQAESIQLLIQDMLDTMRHYQGTGIAAPQIDVRLRVVMFGFPTPRYPDMGDVPQTILINPKVTVLTEETDGYWESCLSVPTLRGYVPRPTKVAYQGYTPTGEWIEREAEGFHARTVQHEIDHLDGVLFPSRVKDARLLAYQDEGGFEVLKQQVAQGLFTESSLD